MHGLRTHSGKVKDMTRKRYKPEEIISKLRAIEVHLAQGMKADQASRQEGIVEQTYYRWRKEYGGLKIDQAKRLKELEKENACLKKLLAEAHLDKAMLQEVAQGNF
jgi:putative transposase